MNLSRHFSKRELVSILELVEDSQNCQTLDQVSSLMLKAKEVLSADYSVCGIGNFSGSGKAEVTALVNCGYPEQWLDLYFKEGLYRFDPVIRYHKRFSPSEIWSEINKLFDDKEAGPVIKTAWDFGLKYGLSGSIFSPDAEMMSLFCFAGENKVFQAHHKLILDTIALHLNLALNNAVCGSSEFIKDHKPAENRLV